MSTGTQFDKVGVCTRCGAVEFDLEGVPVCIPCRKPWQLMGLKDAVHFLSDVVRGNRMGAGGNGGEVRADGRFRVEWNVIPDRAGAENRHRQVSGVEWFSGRPSLDDLARLNQRLLAEHGWAVAVGLMPPEGMTGEELRAQCGEKRNWPGLVESLERIGRCGGRMVTDDAGVQTAWTGEVCAGVARLALEMGSESTMKPN